MKNKNNAKEKSPFSLKMRLQYWFDNASDPSDCFVLPGYTLSVLKTDEYTKYFILPPADQIPQLNNQST